MNLWRLPLHWKIIIGLILGLFYGILSAAMGWSRFTEDWITPFGDIFLNLLKVIAVPLVLGSLIMGVASLSDVRKLSRIGGRTIAIYILTTTVSVTIGLVMVNLLEPGTGVPQGLQEQLQAAYQTDAESDMERAETARERGPLQVFVDMTPDNIFGALSNNGRMLQVVFFSLLFGVALVLIPSDKSKPLVDFFSGLTSVIIQIVNMIMVVAPIGVFALIAKTINQVAQDDLSAVGELLGALGFYCLVVLLGLLIHGIITYPVMLKIFSNMKIGRFFRGIAPAQLLAFSSSSSGATLPVTMDVSQRNLGVSKEVSSFVLPLGATINMDGTALYQAVAAVFIAQALGLGLDMTAQLQIVLTAVLASIGTAAVPGAGIIMLIIILETIGVPAAGIALILGVDRILDMCRTAVNVTGDAAVATSVDAMEKRAAARQSA
ncbi:MAG: dicarboxylate/amino acid:cation symporter [Gemmatimonadetes bacterium]|nr:dicarboxylate/amino acid:cation symporter [Gemmatimonadota bacterium]MYG85272.1 dicarboxylate/amino acid:cation symporter [Gemmatimonadota bacterium]MYJ88939.1 dicarboxylate/amino acid:cation symporter [Gemmatimonadota bacterium]